MRVWKMKVWDGQNAVDSGTYAAPAVAISSLAHRVKKMYLTDVGVQFRLRADNAVEFETRGGDSITLEPDHVIGTDPDPVIDVIVRQSLRRVIRQVMIEVYGPRVTDLVDKWIESGAESAEYRTRP